MKAFDIILPFGICRPCFISVKRYADCLLMQTLHTAALFLVVRFWFYHVLLESRERSDEACPMRLLISLSTEKFSSIMEPAYFELRHKLRLMIFDNVDWVLLDPLCHYICLF